MCADEPCAGGYYAVSAGRDRQSCFDDWKPFPEQGEKMQKILRPDSLFAERAGQMGKNW